MKRQLKRSFVTLAGSFVLLAGILMIPYPGPGWLVVFAGLGILSTEHDWARRLLGFAKDKYDRWTEWVARQSVYVRSLIIAGTALVVILTIWLVNGYGLLNAWLNLGQDWVKSPLV